MSTKPFETHGLKALRSAARFAALFFHADQQRFPFGWLVLVQAAGAFEEAPNIRPRAYAEILHYVAPCDRQYGGQLNQQCSFDQFSGLCFKVAILGQQP